MIPVKLFALAVYAGLGYVGQTQPLTMAANLSLAALAVVSVAHLGECLIYRKLILETPGSSSWHILNVLLFGVLHIGAMRRLNRASREQLA